MKFQVGLILLTSLAAVGSAKEFFNREIYKDKTGLLGRRIHHTYEAPEDRDEDRRRGLKGGSPPVHVIGVEISELDYKTGKDKVVVVNGLGKMIHGRCSQCMTQVFQKPQGENYVALFPPTFRIGGDDSLEQKLPDYYLPRMHTNYENRARDATDSLPKFKTFPPDNEVNADGSLKNVE
ncbi:Glutathione-dependent formaldehyde-activating enzyme [Seminavis robusta]|uniref:Glutathione-dependent formaldehyde-activating enzyme n=1 Tax=Seminavis robusta TaxID=568900 RepID=A0A9N8HLX5_9STRA|nr:Glutathione-dependent formaldehyde-activating enzyme [Seminavis robusta]|eukprot:Sro951_g223990.1 Glutathione-dependent formaldehyde-activating enzyme (179) ;mRNA; r:40130-40666